jgi:S-DNA-T family DNA segregation ATPase FtsK/SpoIIIE
MAAPPGDSVLSVTACDECGYGYDSLTRPQIVGALPELADQIGAILTGTPAAALRAHSRPASWSVLEYGCHVRDVLRIQRERVLLAQVEDMPRFVSMRRDERALEEKYNEQNPAAVATTVRVGARDLADTLAGLDDGGWLRIGIYPWPESHVRTVEWIGRRSAHELAHHLFDCRRLLGVG